VSRAARSLFLLHFKRLVIPLVSVSALLYLASLLALWIAQSVWHLKDAGQGLDIICRGVLLAMALPVGTASFSKAFKEQHILFFHSLPVTRSAAWLSMVGGAFAALAVTAIGFAAVRPGAFTSFAPWGAFVYAAVMVTSFAIGAAAGMAFVRPVAVYVAAYLCTLLTIIGVLLGILGPALMLGQPRRDLPSLTIDTMVGAGRYTPPAAVWWITALLSAIAFFAASHFFFVRGEMTHGRRRLLNPLVLFGIVAALVLFVAPALIWAFTFRSPLESADAALSPDGRYALMTRRSTSVPWRGRIDVVDLTSGHRTRIDANGLTDGAAWIGDNRIGLLRRDLSWWRRPPLSMSARDRLQLYSPDGRQLSQVVLDDEVVHDWRPRANGAVVLGIMRGDQARVVEWRADGTLRELARATGVDGINVGSDAAWARQGTGKARFWTFAGADTQELPIRGAGDAKPPALVEGVAYASAEIAAREIERTIPAPRAAGERALYVLRGWSTGSPSLFAVVPHPERRLVSVLAYAGGWKTISDAVPIRENEVVKVSQDLYQHDLEALEIDRPSGIVTYVARNGAEDVLHLADLRSGKDFEVTRRPASDNITCHVVVRPLRTSIVRVSAGSNPPRRLVLEMVYGNGALMPVERRGEGTLAMLAPDGTQIRGMTAYRVSIAPPNGPVRTIDLK
jgi:hypothetical protein